MEASPRHDLVHLRRSFKPGSFETKPRPEFAEPKELRPAVLSGALRRSALSVSRGGGMLAVAEGDKVCILDAGALAGLGGPGAVALGPGRSTSTSASRGTTSASSSSRTGSSSSGTGSSSVLPPAVPEKAGVRPLARVSAAFEVARVAFNPSNEATLAVSGFTKLAVLTLRPDGEVADRLRVGPEEWPLDGVKGAIRDVLWVPNRPSILAVVVAAHVACLLYTSDAADE